MTTTQEIIEAMGQVVDLSIKHRMKRKNLLAGDLEFYCVFCQDVGRIPPLVRHAPHCVILKVKELLQRAEKTTMEG